MMPVALSRSLWVLALSLLAGCQSEDAEWKKHFDDKALKPPSSAVEERIGNGPVEITLLLPRGSTGIYNEATRDVRDGAALAATELGDSLITIRVVDTSGGPVAAKAAAEAAAARKSGLLLSYANQDVTKAIASIPSEQRPPLINLASAVVADNVFNLAADEVEDVARTLLGTDAPARKSVVIIAPDDLAPEKQTRLTSLIKEGGGNVKAVVRYSETGTSAGSLGGADADVVGNATAILVLGDTASVGKVLTDVRRLNLKAPLLGTQAWPQTVFANPAAEGAIIAASDQEGAGLIADRYKRHKGRPLTINAAHAYDSVAIGSGLLRTGGVEALTASALTSKTGFRGVTGVFRFNQAGSVERTLGLYRVQGGKLVPFEAASPSF